MRRSPLLIVYLTVFIDLLGFGIILPLLPFYAEQLGATGLWVGILFTSYSAAQLVGAPVIGRLSDRFGRRPVLLLGLAGSAVSLTVTGLADTLVLLLASRTAAGLFGGSISAAQAYIADVSRPAERAKYMGMLGAAIGLGFVFGPAIGAGLSPFGFGTAAFVAAGLAALNLAFGYFKLTESRPADRLGTVDSGMTVADYVAAVRDPVISRILTARFLVTAAFVAMETTFALLGAEKFGLDGGTFGIMFAYLGILIVLVQGGLIGRLTSLAGERLVATVGMIMMGLAMFTIPFAPTLLGATIVLGFLAIGQGLTTPTLSSLLSLETGTEHQGGMLGLGQSSTAAARAASPILAGWLFDLDMGLPYYLGAIVLLAAGGLILTMVSRAPAPLAQSQDAD